MWISNVSTLIMFSNTYDLLLFHTPLLALSPRHLTHCKDMKFPGMEMKTQHKKHCSSSKTNSSNYLLDFSNP